MYSCRLRYVPVYSKGGFNLFLLSALSHDETGIADMFDEDVECTANCYQLKLSAGNLKTRCTSTSIHVVQAQVR